MRSVASELGALACEALTFELALAPKPGLVTLVDRGSHGDMDHHTFRASIAALRPYFVDCAALGAEGAAVRSTAGARPAG